ncbi:MAG: TonB-dependent receptor [Candidatus Cloacimonadota bacterium]|nr:TonB-dependent receptor [Candidatus Cloacimonadota bacterium]
MKIRFAIIFFVLLNLSICLQSAPAPTGNIYGYTTDSETKSPLQYVNVIIPKLETGAITDSTGYFSLNNLQTGSYSIEFIIMGYKNSVKTDVIVRSNSDTFLRAELQKSTIQVSGISVQDKQYFSISEKQPTSSVNFSNEEIRRAPGSAGDISRIVMNLPSVAKMDDQKNNLVVRGGSPIENAFFIDNIEIPNINHFPTQGTSGGAIGLLNVDFIENVDFFTGGFSSEYGNRLSSIMNIKYREGNRRRFDGQLDLNFTGFGGILEGPLPSKKGSFLLSVRRSYLDFLVDTIDLGTDIAPNYGDSQGKFVYDIDNKNKLSFLFLCADDHSKSNADTAQKNDMVYYGNQDIYQNTFGLNWRHLWNNNGYSNTSLAYTFTKYNEKLFETGSDNFLLRNDSKKGNSKIRNVNFYRFTDNISAEFGLDTQFQIIDLDNFYNEYENSIGDTISSHYVNKKEETFFLGAFFNLKLSPFNRFSTSIGTRLDYSSYNKNFIISPRFSSSYHLSNITTINGALGLFYQNFPSVFLFQDDTNEKLKTPKAIHFILGVEHLLSEDTKISGEIYRKNYDNFPLDPLNPGVFMIDEVQGNYAFFSHHDDINDNGAAISQGVEVILQKKLAEDFYGIVSGSYFSSKYRDYNGKWSNRICDNRTIFGIEGGYKPNDKWEMSARWIFAGGRPYTPYDLESSIAANHGIFDSTNINGKRYPDYHSLNLRVDRRFHFRKSNLVIYLSVWNAYNRKNIASYYWNITENRRDEIYQWGLLPIFGIEYEF